MPEKEQAEQTELLGKEYKDLKKIFSTDEILQSVVKLLQSTIQNQQAAAIKVNEQTNIINQMIKKIALLEERSEFNIRF